MLQLFVGEAHQRFQRNLVTKPIILADFERLSADVALDQPEDVRVGSPIDLEQEPHFCPLQER